MAVPIYIHTNSVGGFPLLHILSTIYCMHASSLIRVQLFGPHGLQPDRLLCPWNYPSMNTGMGCHFLLQGIFLTWDQTLHLLWLLHWQADSLSLSHICRLSDESHSDQCEVAPYCSFYLYFSDNLHFPHGSDGKEFTCNARDLGPIPSWDDTLEKEMATHSSILAWKSHGQRRLVGCSLWGWKESGMTEWLTLTYLLTQIKGQILSALIFDKGTKREKGCLFNTWYRIHSHRHIIPTPYHFISLIH